MRGSASSICRRGIARAVQHGGNALYCAVDRRSSEVARRALALRLSRHQAGNLMDEPFRSKRDAFLDKVRRRPVVMGILNVTPDSFFDGGRFQTAEAATTHARRLAADG